MNATAGERPVPVLFVHYGDDWIRGSERVLLDLLDGLDRARFAPVVWCNSEAMALEVEWLGVPVARSDFTHVEPDAPFGRGLAGVRRLVGEGRGLVRRYGVRLIHANGGAPTQWMVPVARLEGVPLVAHLHSYYKSHYRHLYLLHEADLVVGCSRFVLEGVAADGVPADRLRVLHNGVSPERLRAYPPVERPAGNAPILTSLGSLITRKGHDVTLRSLALLRERGRPAHLVVLGSGPERATLEALAASLGVSEQVTWMGDRPDASAFLRDATDVLVHSARDEAFGLALLEAGEMGCACVATAVGGTPELIRDGVTGLLVPRDDPEALAAAVERLLADAGLRARLGQALQAHVRSECTLPRMVEKLEGMYDDVLARGTAVAPLRLLPRGAGTWLRYGGEKVLRAFKPSRPPRAEPVAVWP